MLPAERTCPTCGAENDASLLNCAECDEPISDHRDERVRSPGWIETIPPWIRWVVALPGIAIVGSNVIRQLAYAGLNDVTSGLLYPSAIALSIFAAALLASIAAPSYRKHVGLAVAFGDASALYGLLLGVFVLEYIPAPSISALMLAAYIAAPAIGVTAAAFSINRIIRLAEGPREAPSLVAGDYVARLWLAVLAAAGVASAFAGICLGVTVLWYRFLPIGVAGNFTAVIGTGITIVLVAEYAPSRKLFAARVTAAVFLAIGTIGLELAAYYYVHFPYRVSLILFDEASLALSSLSTVCGAALGLRAATLRNEASAATEP